MPSREEELAKVKEAQEEFVREYMMAGPYSEYVSMVGRTFRFIVEWREQDPTRSIEKAEEIRNKLVEAGEDPEECVIVVGLRRPLPEGMSLPNIYKGFRVFVEVIGEIVLH